jgi:hypothetical protein
MKAGIITDAWKVPIFERRLKDAGYTFTKVGDESRPDGLVTFTVVTSNPKALHVVVKAAMHECSVAGETRH